MKWCSLLLACLLLLETYGKSAPRTTDDVSRPTETEDSDDTFRPTKIELSAIIDGPQADTNSSGFGAAIVTYYPRTGELSWKLAWTDLEGSVTVIHFHAGDFFENGPVVVDIGGTSGTQTPNEGSVIITDEEAEGLLSGLWYINIHSDEYPAGEIRGQVLPGEREVVDLQATLSGEQEVPPNDSKNRGYAKIEYDEELNLLEWDLQLDRRLDVVGIHFHAGLPGENGPVMIDIGAISGLGSGQGFALTSDMQGDGILSGRWYINVHTTSFPAGEIRGQVLPVHRMGKKVVKLDAFLSGRQEVPPVDTEGTGRGKVTLDRTTNKLSWTVKYEDLSDDVVGMHFHEGQRGENGPLKVNIGEISGLESGTTGFTFISLADANVLLDGGWYINVHTPTVPSGEIRGQVEQKISSDDEDSDS